MNDIEAERLQQERQQANLSVRKAAQRNLEPLLTTSAPRVSNDLLKPPSESVADTLTVVSRKKKKKKKKRAATNELNDASAVPFPDDPFAQDPFDIAMAQAEREPSDSQSATTKKVTKKIAMPLEEQKGPMQLDMAALVKL